MTDVRVSTTAGLVPLVPGSPTEVELDVVNTSEVIEGVSARVDGLPADHVSARPLVLPLFPDASGRITLTLGVPEAFPAGRHDVHVEVIAHSPRVPAATLAGAGHHAAPSVDPLENDPTISAAAHVKLAVEVRSRPRVTATAVPSVVRTRRRATFPVEVRNTGNTPLDVAVDASGPDERTAVAAEPRTVNVPVGGCATVLVRARGPRLWTGGDVDRGLHVDVVAAPAPTSVGAGGGLVADDTVALTLRQRPLLSRGVITALVLLGIVGLWAAAFLLGLTKVFSAEPVTKTAPASFFVGTATAGDASGAGAGTAATGGTGDPGSGLAALTLSKTGRLPAGVGGVISGTITAESDGSPVGRLLVEAYHRTRDGLELAGSAATQSDGAYGIAGLFPGDYLIRVSAEGFTTQWYPAAPDDAGAEPVPAAVEGPTTGVDMVVTGQPATIRGAVDPGNTLNPVVTTVVARLATGGAAPSDDVAPIGRTTTAADGSWELTGLPAPGSYELTFTTPGYRATTVIEHVGGGQARITPTVLLGAGDGVISGRVTSGGDPVGGVAVATTINGLELTTGTPTTGTIGRFTLTGLPTPGTYVITFSRDGFGAQTVVVDLDPGEQVSDLQIDLVAGSGMVTGHLVDSTGAGLGGALVTVGGATEPMSTTTLTTGDIGAFAVSGLAVPGTYTLTFTTPGYLDVTVPLVLDATGPPDALTVEAVRATTTLAGTVFGPDGAPLAGATITVTDGLHTWTGVSTDYTADQGAGYFLIGAIPAAPAGTVYHVTAIAPETGQQTTIVTLVAGVAARQDFHLPADG